ALALLSETADGAASGPIALRCAQGGHWPQGASGSGAAEAAEALQGGRSLRTVEWQREGAARSSQGLCPGHRAAGDASGPTALRPGECPTGLGLVAEVW